MASENICYFSCISSEGFQWWNKEGEVTSPVHKYQIVVMKLSISHSSQSTLACQTISVMEVCLSHGSELSF